MFPELIVRQYKPRTTFYSFPPCPSPAARYASANLPLIIFVSFHVVGEPSSSSYVVSLVHLRLGHCCCKSCVGNILNARRPVCHSCRAPINREDVKPIFLDFVEPRTAFATTVVDGLDRMGVDSKSISVTKARDKIKQTAENIEAEKEVAVGGLLSLFPRLLTPMAFPSIHYRNPLITSTRELFLYLPRWRIRRLNWAC